MTPKIKAIIIIIGAVILFGLLIAVIFDLLPSKDEEGGIQDQGQQVVLPDRGEGLPENSVFDSQNASQFGALNPSALISSSKGELEKEAQDLAVFFIERFGTYSSDADFANIDDLLGFMTPDLQSEMDSYKNNQPERDGYFAITSDIASIDTASFLPQSRTAQFSAVMNRTEESTGRIDQYQQEVVIDLKQDNSGLWSVDGVIWGERR